MVIDYIYGRVKQVRCVKYVATPFTFFTHFICFTYFTSP